MELEVEINWPVEELALVSGLRWDPLKVKRTASTKVTTVVMGQDTGALIIHTMGVGVGGLWRAGHWSSVASGSIVSCWRENPMSTSLRRPLTPQARWQHRQGACAEFKQRQALQESCWQRNPHIVVCVWELPTHIWDCWGANIARCQRGVAHHYCSQRVATRGPGLGS